MSILKVSVTSAAILALTSTSVWAIDNQASWQGFTTVASRTAACGRLGGTSINDTAVSIYRPHIAVGDTPTFLSQIYTRYAISFKNTAESTAHQMHGSGKYAATVINHRAKAFTYGGGTYNLTITPARIVATTPYVTITGTINNFLNTAGCNIGIKGTYVKEP
jgi:hypothetical protein